MTTNKKSTHADQPVWFITGCSTGFGRNLAKHVLNLGHRTVVTARKLDAIEDLSSQGNALLLKLDVTEREQVNSAVQTAEEKFGRIDVLVNNAGIGYFAAVEEGEDDQIHRLFDINVFGLSRMIRAVLPGMRKRRHGAIINISSIGGLCSAPGLGYYNATKFAVEGLSGALEKEVSPLGIKVMVVEPSGFRTDWAGRSADQSREQIEDYAKTAGAKTKEIRDLSGKQAGDPVRAAEAIVNAIESQHTPKHLLLGNDAYDAALANLGYLRQEFSNWQKLSRGADFPVSV